MPEKYPPFQGDIQHNNPGRKSSLEKNPEKVIRETFGRGEDRNKNAEELFHELSQKYGISVLPYKIIVGPSSQYDGAATYLATDRVHGLTIDRAMEIPLEQREKIRDAMEDATIGIINMYLEKYEHGGPYLDDLKLSQFMFGHTATDSQDKLYLIDLDPFIAWNEEGNTDRIVTKISNLLQDIGILAQKNKMHFEGLHQFVSEQLPKLQSGHRDQMNIVLSGAKII